MVETIKADHPVRKEFANCSTGPGHIGYYDTKGHAVSAFIDALLSFDFYLARPSFPDFSGDEGRKTIAVHDEHGNEVGRAVFTWFQRGSGRYEFIGYLV